MKLRLIYSLITGCILFFSCENEKIIVNNYKSISISGPGFHVRSPAVVTKKQIRADFKSFAFNDTNFINDFNNELKNLQSSFSNHYSDDTQAICELSYSENMVDTLIITSENIVLNNLVFNRNEKLINLIDKEVSKRFPVRGGSISE